LDTVNQLNMELFVPTVDLFSTGLKIRRYLGLPAVSHRRNSDCAGLRDLDLADVQAHRD
jgi:hypothetical protein